MSNPPSISFEFFPPRTLEAQAKLARVRDKLATTSADFFSVTYGAGGSTKQGTRDTVVAIHKAGYDVAPHLSFTGSSDSDVRHLLEDYQQLGVNRLIALRGDRPSGVGGYREQMVYASQLIEFVRAEFGDYFHISVAAYPEMHPESSRFDKELHYFKIKVDAGANQAITQYFYNIDAYHHFVECCQKKNIDIPIVPGIMPITNLDRLARFSKMCEAEIPRWLYRRLENFGDDQKGLKAFGLEFVSRLCQQLLDAGAPGLHFYTLNQSEPSTSIVKNITPK